MAPQVSPQSCPINRKRRILEYLEKDQTNSKERKINKEIELMLEQLVADSVDVSGIRENPKEELVIYVKSKTPPAKRRKLSDAKTELPTEEMNYVFKNGIVSRVPVRKPKQNEVVIEKQHKPLPTVNAVQLVRPIAEDRPVIIENRLLNKATDTKANEFRSLELRTSTHTSTPHIATPAPSEVDENIENSSNDRFPFTPVSNPDCVVIGPGGTVVSKDFFVNLDWSPSAAIITRKLLMEIFGRAILSTHSLTGKPSPAFLEMAKPTKKPLDSVKVADIVFLVTEKKNVKAKEVRLAITSKCADEQKMLRSRKSK